MALKLSYNRISMTSWQLPLFTPYQPHFHKAIKVMFLKHQTISLPCFKSLRGFPVHLKVEPAPHPGPQGPTHLLTSFYTILPAPCVLATLAFCLFSECAKTVLPQGLCATISHFLYLKHSSQGWAGVRSNITSLDSTWTP